MSEQKESVFEKICKIVFISLTIGLTIWLSLRVTYDYFEYSIGLYSMRAFEMLCYMLYAFCFYILYIFVNKRIKKWKNKFFLAASVSLLLTALVFTMNNIWKYIRFNAVLGWEEAVPLLDFFKNDILYSEQYAEFRYPVLFLGMIAICIISTWISSRFPKWVKKLVFWMCPKVISMLDYCIESYIDGECDIDDLRYCLDELPESDTTKSLLINAISYYDIYELYETLYDKCSDRLTDEESEMIDERFKSIFGRSYYEIKKIMDCDELLDIEDELDLEDDIDFDDKSDDPE